jgi:hypothetical protein
VLTAVILMSPSVLCDIRIQGDKSSLDFDFLPHGRIVNYRCNLRTIEIRDGETIKARFETATLDVVYADLDSATFMLSFAGSQSDRAHWLRRALSIFFAWPPCARC